MGVSLQIAVTVQYIKVLRPLHRFFSYRVDVFRGTFSCTNRTIVSDARRVLSSVTRDRSRIFRCHVIPYLNTMRPLLPWPEFRYDSVLPKFFLGAQVLVVRQSGQQSVFGRADSLLSNLVLTQNSNYTYFFFFWILD